MSLLLDEFGWLKNPSPHANVVINKALAALWRWGAFQKLMLALSAK